MRLLNPIISFNIIYIMRTLPLDSEDPNIGRSKRDRRQISVMQNQWDYGFNAPVAVRYSGDAYSQAGWLWPVDKTGKSIKSMPYTAVGFYVAKYVNKKTNLDVIKKIGGNEWNETLKTRLLEIPSKVFRVRMSRNFGMKLPSMAHLSLDCLVQLSRLTSRSSPLQHVLRQNARRSLRSRLAVLSVSDILEAQPVTINLLKSLRISMQTIRGLRRLSFMSITTPKLNDTDISEESRAYLDLAGITFEKMSIKSSFYAGGK